MPQVSVIIPIRNVEGYIDKCLESVLCQTFGNMEVLLVNGLSQDHSLEKCIAWQKKDSRIVVISRKDCSPGDARNYGLRAASGTYIAYVDADDCLAPDYLEKMIAPFMEDPSLDMTCCGYDEVEGDRVRKTRLPAETGAVSCDFAAFLSKVPVYAVWTKVCRRQLLLEKRIEMYSDGHAEDVSMFFMLAAWVKKIYFLREALYHYHLENEGRLTRTAIKKGMVDHCKAISFAFEYLKANGVYEPDVCGKRLINEACFVLNINRSREVVDAVRQVLQTYSADLIEPYRRVDKTVKKDLILFGTGEVAERALCEGVITTGNLRLVVDNNKRVQGTLFHGIPVVSPDALATMPDATVLVATDRFFYEVSQQLMAMGIYNFMPVGEYKTGE